MTFYRWLEERTDAGGELGDLARAVVSDPCESIQDIETPAEAWGHFASCQMLLGNGWRGDLLDAYNFVEALFWIDRRAEPSTPPEPQP